MNAAQTRPYTAYTYFYEVDSAFAVNKGLRMRLCPFVLAPTLGLLCCHVIGDVK